MYLIVIGWLYVALMMAVAEVTHPAGTLLGGIISFFLYGLGPVALVVYLMGSPLRRKAIKAREAAEQADTPAPPDGTTISTSNAPDTGREATADTPVPAVGKKP